MPHDPFGAVQHGMCWCPHCNGYGSPLREDTERCTHCAGPGLVVDEAAALSAERGGERFAGRTASRATTRLSPRRSAAYRLVRERSGWALSGFRPASAKARSRSS